MLPACVRTGRLELRPPALDDAPAIFNAYASDPEVTRFLPWKPHASVDVTRAFVASLVEGLDAGNASSWVLDHDGSPVGMVNARFEGHKVRFGYVLARSKWGRGLMAEAVGALVERALAMPTVYRAWAFCDAENSASARVLEKVGMTREGVLRRFVVPPAFGPEPRDALCYAIVR
jgi:ribosomal-protein-alanine N-acetyltransferase